MNGLNIQWSRDATHLIPDDVTTDEADIGVEHGRNKLHTTDIQ